MELLRLTREFLFPDSVEARAIPSLDGGLVPNDKLDEATPVAELPEPDDAVVAPDGAVLVSSANAVVRFSGPGFEKRETYATLPCDAIGGLALEADGSLLACCGGIGLVRVRGMGVQPELVADRAKDDALRCLTSVAVTDDGTILATDGSRKHKLGDWVRDLMEKGSSGRLVAIAKDGSVRVVKDGLAWPSGIVALPSGDAALLSEAWRHTIHRIDLAKGKLDALAENMAGYPARLTPDPAGGFWTAFPALRTHLVEFVLSEDEYRTEMMRTIDPRWWIRPDLRSLNSGLVPLQGGGIRKLGRVKPWAPPRSYGLAALLDDEGEARTSLHSRADGRHHGITSVRRLGDGSLLLVSKGGDRVLRAPAALVQASS